jgi:hypothetical protein
VRLGFPVRCTMTGDEIRNSVTVLAEWFPAFTADVYLPHRPLRIGIHDDLAARCPALTAVERAVVLRLARLPNRRISKFQGVLSAHRGDRRQFVFGEVDVRGRH